MQKRHFKAILADLDGTVHRGAVLIDGALETYKTLSNKGVQWVFLSNNAARLDIELTERLIRLGFDIKPEQMITSATALLETIKTDYVGASFAVVAEENLVAGMVKAGAVISDNPENAEIVVTALDTKLTYDKLKAAHIALQRGALFWATNLDPAYPGEKLFYPGAGSIAAAVATAAGRQPDRVFGKPYPDMGLTALKRLGLQPEDCVVLGDRMETDILLAKNVGMYSVLALTGATSRAQLTNYNFAPDYIIDSIADLGVIML